MRATDQAVGAPNKEGEGVGAEEGGGGIGAEGEEGVSYSLTSRYVGRMYEDDVGEGDDLVSWCLWRW